MSHENSCHAPRIRRIGAYATIALTLTLLALAPPKMLRAQPSSYLHSNGIFLIDGLGHSVTLLPPTTGSGGGIITLPPSGLVWPNANAIGALTNDGSGNLSWVPVAGVYLPLAGGTMSGAIHMASQDITGAGTVGALAFSGGSASVTTLTASSTVTLSGLSAVGLLHTNGAGLLSTSLLTDANVAGAAAIQYSKLSGTPTSLPPSGVAGGSLAGTYPDPTLANNSVTHAEIAAGTIQNADVSPTAAIQYSKIAGPSSLPPNGLAGGDLSGTYPNPTLVSNSVASSQILDGTIIDADIAAGAGIPASKLNLTNAVSATDFSASGLTPTTFLRGDGTWATAGFAIPYSLTTNTSGSLFYITQLGTGSAIQGQATSGVGVFGTTSGGGDGVVGWSDAGASGTTIEALCDPGSSALPIRVYNQGSGSLDISSSNWSIDHNGSFYGNGSALTGITNPVVLPYSDAGTTGSGFPLLTITQNGLGDAIMGYNSGSGGAGVIGFASNTSTGSAISAIVNGTVSAVPIRIGNYGTGATDIAGYNWNIGYDGTFTFRDAYVSGDGTIGTHNRTPAISGVGIASSNEYGGATYNSWYGSDVAGSILYYIPGDYYSGANGGADVTVTFATPFPAGSVPVVEITPWFNKSNIYSPSGVTKRAYVVSQSNTGFTIRFNCQHPFALNPTYGIWLALNYHVIGMTQ